MGLFAVSSLPLPPRPFPTCFLSSSPFPPPLISVPSPLLRVFCSFFFMRWELRSCLKISSLLWENIDKTEHNYKKKKDVTSILNAVHQWIYVAIIDACIEACQRDNLLNVIWFSWGSLMHICVRNLFCIIGIRNNSLLHKMDANHMHNTPPDYGLEIILTHRNGMPECSTKW